MIIRVRRISDGQYVTPADALKESRLRIGSSEELDEPEGFALSEYNGLMVFDGFGNYVWITRDNYDVEFVI